jgi:predicted negative regulator of RcsB-dependent stress response
MSVYMTEDEQLESIKKWWKRYGTVISVCLSIILLSVVGYRYLHWHQEKMKQQASVTYEKMMNEFSNENTKAVRSYANDLIKNHTASVYADVAHMTLAKLYLSKDKFDRAKEELQVVVTNSKINTLKQTARIRIARILAAQNAYSQAFEVLSTVDDSIYLPVINELKGDMYASQKKYQDAISSYRVATDEVKSKDITNLFLEMKTNELASKKVL